MLNKKKIVYYSPELLKVLKQNMIMSDKTWAMVRFYGGSFD